jgi:hypothetical protein
LGDGCGRKLLSNENGRPLGRRFSHARKAKENQKKGERFIFPLSPLAAPDLVVLSGQAQKNLSPFLVPFSDDPVEHNKVETISTGNRALALQ